MKSDIAKLSPCHHLRGTVIGWTMDNAMPDRPNAKAVGPTVPASTFPVKF